MIDTITMKNILKRINGLTDVIRPGLNPTLEAFYERTRKTLGNPDRPRGLGDFGMNINALSRAIKEQRKDELARWHNMVRDDDTAKWQRLAREIEHDR